MTERLSSKLLDPVVLLLTILLEKYQKFDKTTIFFFRFLLNAECQIRLFKNNGFGFVFSEEERLVGCKDVSVSKSACFANLKTSSDPSTHIKS